MQTLACSWNVLRFTTSCKDNDRLTPGNFTTLKKHIYRIRICLLMLLACSVIHKLIPCSEAGHAHVTF